MKKELVAVSILVVLIALSLFNIGFVAGKTEVLRQEAKDAQQLLREGKPEQAHECLSDSLKRWQSFSKYAGVMLRHSDEITDVSDSYFEIMKELEQTGSAPTALFKKLDHILVDIAEAESLSFSSLF